MKLSQFTERTNTAHIKIMDESKSVEIDEIDVTYRPSTWTPEFEERMQEATGLASTLFANILPAAVVSWTLTDDETQADGTVTTAPVELTVDRLMKIPSNLLSQIVGGISDDMRPKVKSPGS